MMFTILEDIGLSVNQVGEVLVSMVKTLGRNGEVGARMGSSPGETGMEGKLGRSWHSFRNFCQKYGTLKTCFFIIICRLDLY